MIRKYSTLFKKSFNIFFFFRLYFFLMLWSYCRSKSDSSFKNFFRSGFFGYLWSCTGGPLVLSILNCSPICLIAYYMALSKHSSPNCLFSSSPILSLRLWPACSFINFLKNFPCSSLVEVTFSFMANDSPLSVASYPILLRFSPIG